MKPGTVENHRSREGGAIIYPVYSRRSRGLSVGVNLFPDRKLCSFDCPYCEVFPFQSETAFNLETMKAALRDSLLEAARDGIPVMDICFSGNGEPTMSPCFPGALRLAAELRDKLTKKAKLVLITNGSGLLDPAVFDVLENAAKTANGAEENGLHIWLKLDAGTESWYRAINRSGVPFGALIDRIQAFAASGAPFTLQTMVCTVNGALPPAEEEAAWIALTAELADISRKAGPGLRSVQLYGKARPAPEDPFTEAVPAEVIEKRAKLLRAALINTIPVEVYP